MALRVLLIVFLAFPLSSLAQKKQIQELQRDMALLQDEIRQQPQVLATLIDQERKNTRRIAADLQARGIDYVIIAARGTSDNAARYGQYLLAAHNQLPVGLATPSLFSVYGEPPRLAGSLVIGISQSGLMMLSWRRGRDSNPRGTCIPAGFQVRLASQ